VIATFLLEQVEKVRSSYLLLLGLECSIPLVMLIYNLPAIEYMSNSVASAAQGDSDKLLIGITGFVLTSLVYEMLRRIKDRVKISVVTSLRFKTFHDLTSKLIKCDSLYFKNNDPVGLVYTVKNVSDSAERVLLLCITSIKYIVYLIAIPIKAYYINPKCAYIICSWICAWAGALYVLFKYVDPAVILLARSRNRLLMNLSDTLHNIESVFLYKTHSHEETKLGNRLRAIVLQDKNLQTLFWYMWLGQSAMFAMIIYLNFLVLYYAQCFIVGTFMALYKIISELSDIIWSSADYIFDLIDNYGKLANGLLVLSSTPIVQISSSSIGLQKLKNLGNQAGVIEFNQVTFTYNNFTQFNFNCQIKEGEMVALVGKSGSGKSTFIRLVLGMINPTSGKIINTIIKDEDEDSFTYIPQNVYLFQESIRYNLTYGIRRRISDSEIKEALYAASCDFIYDLPQRYDTVITKHNLSGGQAQRILIARSILMDSKVLVFDEPTSALDRQTEVNVMHYIAKLKSTKITIARKIDTIKSADKVLIFEGGRIVASGSNQELKFNQHYLRFCPSQI